MLGVRFALHSQLSIGRQGALAGGQRLLLRQGENDMACGHHCVLMALMLLGVVQRDALYDEDMDERLNEVCAIGQSRYFTGCLVTHIKQQSVPFDEQVRCRHLQQDVAARTVTALEADQVCPVRFTSHSDSHWVLAVVVMYVGEVPEALLVLDPLMDAVPLTPWNALLEHWGTKRLRNTNARWSEKAVIEKVLQVGISKRGLTKTVRYAVCLGNWCFVRKLKAMLPGGASNLILALASLECSNSVACSPSP